MSEVPKDRTGREVAIGSRVKVVAINSKFLESLPDDEREQVASMLNEVFEVYDIDEYGQPWVEKWWRISDGESTSHSLALASSEMELC